MIWEKKSFKTIMVSKLSELLKTSYVPLPKALTFDASDCSAESPSRSSMQQTEGAQITPPVANSVPESLLSSCCEVNEQQQGECQSSDGCNYPKPLCPFFVDFVIRNYMLIFFSFTGTT